MISDAAMDDLRRFADVGRIGAGIVALSLTADNLLPIIGQVVTVRWNLGDGGVDMGVLSIPGLGRFAVSAVGEKRIQVVDAEELNIELQADEQSANIVIEPRAIIPQVISFGAMDRCAILGEKININWEIADAEEVVLFIQDGGRSSHYDVSWKGVVRVTPHNLGNLLISITARSRHAVFAEEATIRIERQIPVEAPPVNIEIEQTDQTGYVGDEVQFAWRISGAVSAYVIAIDREQQFDVPLIGGMQVEIDGIESEKFCLIAIGADDIQHTTKLSVIPKLLDVGLYPEELSYLTINWE